MANVEVASVRAGIRITPSFVLLDPDRVLGIVFVLERREALLSIKGGSALAAADVGEADVGLGREDLSAREPELLYA